MAMFETLIQLFTAFAKIGFTSFGGTSMIPLIMDEMSSHGWMTDADLTNLIAIAEMTPGSLGVNAATFAGTKDSRDAGRHLCGPGRPQPHPDPDPCWRRSSSRSFAPARS